MTDIQSLRVGLLQPQLRWSSPAENRAHLQALLEEKYSEADVVVMPETLTTGFLGDPGAGEGMDGPTVAWMQELAENRACAIAGSAVIKTGSGMRNRFLWVEPGGVVRFYDKRHLFSYAGEDKHYVAGRERVVFGYRGWRICPQICYDIRFPVWCRSLRDYDMLLVVANWPSPRIDAWSALLKARAIENQCYVVAVNRVGEDGRGTHYTGQSVIRDPLGGTVLHMGSEESYAEALIDLSLVSSLRTEMPFHAEADSFEIH